MFLYVYRRTTNDNDDDDDDEGTPVFHHFTITALAPVKRNGVDSDPADHVTLRWSVFIGG